MKRNATVRVVIYSAAILLLVTVLILGIGMGNMGFVFSDGDYTKGPGSIHAGEIRKLEIDWAAGSVTVATADTDEITFSDSGSSDHSMGYSVKNGVLKLRYNSGVIIGFGSVPKKDLTVTVPQDWICQEFEFDGASVEMEIQGLTVQEMELDGASNELVFSGSLGKLDCDGASNKITVNCTNTPSSIDLDGASVTLDLTMPEDSGFRVEMDGLSCSFRSDYSHQSHDGTYTYGKEACRINADGVSCKVYIKKP